MGEGSDAEAYRQDADNLMEILLTFEKEPKAARIVESLRAAINLLRDTARDIEENDEGDTPAIV